MLLGLPGIAPQPGRACCAEAAGGAFLLGKMIRMFPTPFVPVHNAQGIRTDCT